MIKKYLKNILISIDQFFNTLFGGSPDETISSRLGRNYKNSFLEKFVDWIFSWQKKSEGHCESAIEWDENENDSIFK